MDQQFAASRNDVGGRMPIAAAAAAAPAQPEVPAAFSELVAASERLQSLLGDLAARLNSVVQPVPSRGMKESGTASERVPLAAGISYQADRLTNMTADVQALLDGLQL